jgi:lysozyme
MKPFNVFSAKGSTFTRLHEGFVSRWYLDPVGVPTIGIGFTWRSDSFRVWWANNKPGVEFKRGVTMTRAEADDALQYLVNNEYGKAVNDFLGATVPQNIYDGMVSPVFNMGPGSLKWTWAAAIKRGDIKDGARRLTTTGTTADGVRLAGLVRRRKEEAVLIRDGVYIGVDTPHSATGERVLVDAMADGMLERGERGVEVAELIVRLHALGFYDGTLDDVYGHGTQAAVLDYQRENSLVADGKAGPVTLAHIAKKSEPVAEKHWLVKLLLKILERFSK